ncbi:uncharacterized protein C8A04DRAFT_24947 [Dichotomopilus funicola]|uniref:Uncharacterized protein n=1 Tax=Dichotomopilus funicola TaxID=1934379 RepID=A0AAN6VBN5_9PEZI|nr:hypothetical protein C8A04DRAFT_24947 [Dichotomopilus funicola]
MFAVAPSFLRTFATRLVDIGIVLVVGGLMSVNNLTHNTSNITLPNANRRPPPPSLYPHHHLSSSHPFPPHPATTHPPSPPDLPTHNTNPIYDNPITNNNIGNSNKNPPSHATTTYLKHAARPTTITFAQAFPAPTSLPYLDPVPSLEGLCLDYSAPGSAPYSGPGDGGRKDVGVGRKKDLLGTSLQMGWYDGERGGYEDDGGDDGGEEEGEDEDGDGGLGTGNHGHCRHDSGYGHGHELWFGDRGHEGQGDTMNQGEENEGGWDFNDRGQNRASRLVDNDTASENRYQEREGRKRKAVGLEKDEVSFGHCKKLNMGETQGQHSASQTVWKGKGKEEVFRVPRFFPHNYHPATVEDAYDEDCGGRFGHGFEYANRSEFEGEWSMGG